MLAYVSGANQLSEAKLAAAAGGERCARVDADTVRAATGYPIGGVPPFGHATELDVFVDPDLLAYDEVWAAAGTWHDVFPLAPADLVRDQRRHRHRPQALTEPASIRVYRCRGARGFRTTHSDGGVRPAWGGRGRRAACSRRAWRT